MLSAEQSSTNLAAPEHLNSNGLNTLVQFNMPQSVIDYVRTRPGLPSWVFFTALAAFLTLFVVLVLAIAMPLTRAPIPRWMVDMGLLPSDTLLADVQLLSPILGIVMLAILLSYMVFTLVTLLHRGFAIRAALVGIQRSANRQNELWFLRQCLRRIKPSLPPEEYLLAYHWAAIRVVLWMGIWILIPTLLLGSWELLSSSYATPQGFKAGGMFVWRRPFVTWDQVEKLSTGAIDARTTRYVLHFSGSSRDLSHWRLLNGHSDNLLVLARIDDELRMRDVPWEVAVYDFGVHRGEPQWDLAAFQKLRGELNLAQRSLFDRVYRYPRQERIGR